MSIFFLFPSWQDLVLVWIMICMPGRNLDFPGFPVCREAHEIRQTYGDNILLEVYWAWFE